MHPLKKRNLIAKRAKEKAEKIEATSKFKKNPSQRLARGKDGEQLAAAWLRAQKFHILRLSERAARAWGGGEIDLLAEDPQGEIWLFEVKSHLEQMDSQLLLSFKQRRRLHFAYLWATQRFPRKKLHLALLWVDPVSHRVELLENP